MPALGAPSTAGGNHVQPQARSWSRSLPGALFALAGSAPTACHQLLLLAVGALHHGVGGAWQGAPHAPTNPTHIRMPTTLSYRQELPFPLSSYTLGNYAILCDYV